MVSLAFITVHLEFKITGRVKMNTQALSTTLSFLDKMHCLLINMTSSVIFIMYVEKRYSLSYLCWSKNHLWRHVSAVEPIPEGLGGPSRWTHLLSHSVFAHIYLIFNQTDNLFNPQFPGIKLLYHVCVVFHTICSPAMLHKLGRHAPVIQWHKLYLHN